MKKEKTKIVILAAGKGKRMESELPKVLVPLKGKALIKHLLESVEKTGLPHPTIVIGYEKELVKKELGDKYSYVIQEEQLGTGHAVNMARNLLKDASDNIIILYGDQPFTSTETINKLVEKQNMTGAKIVMATIKVPDFEDWRVCFKNFGRIVRKEDGKIKYNVEAKDATEVEKKITEVNPCYFCFDSDFLWNELENIKNKNVQKEYLLTDIIKLATEQGINIETIEIDPREALGANTKEELKALEKFIK